MLPPHNPTQRAMLEDVCVAWGLPKGRSVYFTEDYHPNIHVTNDSISIGRVRLPKSKEVTIAVAFLSTAHATCALCVQHLSSSLILYCCSSPLTCTAPRWSAATKAFRLHPSRCAAAGEHWHVSVLPRTCATGWRDGHGKDECGAVFGGAVGARIGGAELEPTDGQC